MDRNSRGNAMLALIGVVLVVIGASLLLGRVFGPLLAPVAAVLHAFGHLLWPVALIALGALLLVGRIGASADRRPVGGVYRSRSDRVIGGVLGGVAERFEVDAALVRIVFAVATVLTGVWLGVVLYIAAMVLLPEPPVTAATAPSVSASTAPIPPGGSGR